jgi:RimJ/RimL family protein N-acetyltransferase
MAVVFHADAEAFAREAHPVASRSPSSEAFVAVWCAGFRQRPPEPGVRWLFATAEVDGARALAMQHGANPIVLEHGDPAAVRAIAGALADAGHEVPGVHGSEEACAAFADLWRERYGLKTAERVRVRHHVLDTVSPVPSPAGAMRVADASDRDWLVEALDAFVDEARVPRAPQGNARMVEQRVADGRYRVWDDGGVVAFLGAHLAGVHARIGPVYTPKAKRGRGYATALVAAASRELLARGARRVFLTTDVANPVSNAIYARVGFRPVDDMVEYVFVAP